MISPSEIVENLVALLRAIPDLVIEMDGDEQRIFAYHDRHPKNVSIDQARYLLSSPGIMVAWQGTRQGARGGYGAWQHDISIDLRAREEVSDPPDGYYRLYRLIAKGVPTTGDGQPVIYASVHASCDPLGDVPPITRQTDAAGIDFFQILMSFIEIGDE